MSMIPAGSEVSATKGAAGSGGNSSSRHTAVKEVLHARLSTAGEACHTYFIHIIYFPVSTQ
jgi:hypothetical protein